MIEEIWSNLVQNQLTLDQTDAPLELERSQVERFYLPLAEALIPRVSSRRMMVAVAGPPGSGKSAFAALLVAVLNARAGAAQAALVGLDGWHHPNVYLDSHYVERDGESIPLRALKGSPESFDALAVLDCLRAIRQGEEITYPIYSRSLHDPLPEGGRILASHHFVIVEGNFLLLDEDPWRQFREIFELGIFIQASLEVCLAGLLERHRRSGKSDAAIRHQVEAVDLPNARRILQNSRKAEIVVEKDDPRRIQRIQGIG